MGVGVGLKEFLKHENMTIKELAAKTQIPVNTLYSISKRGSCRIETLAKIADTLGYELAISFNPKGGERHEDYN